jgi:hypothetical protein
MSAVICRAPAFSSPIETSDIAMFGYVNDMNRNRPKTVINAVWRRVGIPPP